VRLLVLISAYNQADTVGTTVDAVVRQTFPVEEILLVDNASTDGTAELAYPEIVTTIRNRLDLGISGGVTTGFNYARAHGYDWIWVLDADSVPRPDALELLTRLVEVRGLGGRRDIGIIGSSHNLAELGQVLQGRRLTPGGPRLPRLDRNRNYLDCDGIIWCGALINLAVVERVGWPRMGKLGFWEDLSMDYGDHEFAYRVHRAGYAILVHRDSIIDHRVGQPLRRSILGWTLYTTNHTAVRRYLYFRNLVFFWLRLYHRRNWPMLLVWFSYRLSLILAGIILLERGRGPKLKACLLGIRDGLRGRLDGRFEPSP
jgi:GT2 family glycosyltransferase